MSRPPGNLGQRQPDRPNSNMPTGVPHRSWRWVLGALVAVVVLALVVSNLAASTQPQSVSYSTFLSELRHALVPLAVARHLLLRRCRGVHHVDGAAGPRPDGRDHVDRP